MFRPLALYIGLRYTRAKRRNHFISFISLSSMLGVALGVMALIVILSVMNGFEKELRHRILGMTAHVNVEGRDEAPVTDWRKLVAKMDKEPHVIGAAPFVHAEAMLIHDGYVNGSVVEGVDPKEEPRVSFVGRKMLEGSLNNLKAGEFGIILGRGLARSLRADIGDKVTVISPQPMPTPAGIIPRSRRFTVVGIFEVGMHEYDTALALTNLEDAAKLFRVAPGVTGVRMKLDDVFAAPAVRKALAGQLAGQYRVIDWTEQHVSFFKALKVEKVMMTLILTLIVAVAAFNIVSTLVMVVTDKQADIAILRTLGLSPRAVMSIFIIQGVVIGMIGTLLGGTAGVWLGANLQQLARRIEHTFGVQFMDPNVYYISEVPSDLHWSDVHVVVAIAFILCLLATLYPAWRAARTQPAEALRYE